MKTTYNSLKLKLSCGILIGLTVLMTGSANATVITNLLTNGGFETGSSVPTGWVSNVGGGSYSYITGGTPGENVYEGTRAVAIYDTTTTGNNSRWSLTNAARPVVTGDTTYELEIMVKTENLDSNDEILFLINWFTSAGAAISTAEIRYSGNSDWRNLTLTAIAPANAGLARIGFAFDSTDGSTAPGAKMTFDNVVFGESVPEPATMGILTIGSIFALVRYRKSR